MGTSRKEESCLCEKKAVPAPEKCNHPTSLRSREVAVTDGHLLKGGFKWGCITCWQGGEKYPNLNHMCVLIFPSTFTTFSLSPHFFLFLSSSHSHYFLPFATFTSSFLYVLSRHLCLSLLPLLTQISPARLENLYFFQGNEEIRSIGSIWGMPPPAKQMEKMKSWCSGSQQISTFSPVRFTLFTIRKT